ncbi:hypothetical protein PIIN_03342 [Serendipita indica DSM 11827]|uniref:Uncharacterized protein n=1 Tax=Serendipita indica (strain DSM 11827) TaxID=1109443 RepID=G4TDQ7_SERID|nr:hypothetical protein PIIN_03342 [Serendipita indica DSM 11827]
MSAQQASMQLLQYRSPASVQYDKVAHGIFSPASTVRIPLPLAAATRSASKPPLPLPGSAKAVPRPQRTSLQAKPVSTTSVLSPPVIGLDLALMPPADHRDSAMSPRNSVNVRTTTGARASRLAPIDIPRRTSKLSTVSNRPVWKPVSAPTPASPISAGPPPERSPITSPPSPDQRPPTPPPKDIVDTHELSKHPSASAVSIDRSVMPAATLMPSKPTTPEPTAHVNERAEILARTISSNNLHQAYKTESAPAVVSQEQAANTEVELPAIDIVPPSPARHRPAPMPLQPLIIFPADALEDLGERPPLRVVNVTSDFGLDSMASVPVAPQVVMMPEPPVAAPSSRRSTNSSIASSTTLNSTPSQEQMTLDSDGPTITMVPIAEPAVAPVPKHQSLPVPAPNREMAGPSQPMRYSHLPRVSLTDAPVPSPSVTGTPGPFKVPKIPPPTRNRYPRTLTVPTPLAQPPQVQPVIVQSTSAQQPPSRRASQLPQAPQAPIPFPQYAPAHEPQGPPRPYHVHTRSDPPPSTPLRNQRTFAPPEPSFVNPDYYSSDDDDPSKWAPYPEAPPSRRSSRSLNGHRNSIYAARVDSEDEDILYPLPSISLPNLHLRPILQTGDDDTFGRNESSKRIKFAVPDDDGVDKPSQAAGGRRRIRRRSNSTDSVVRGPKQIPWLQESDVPDRRRRSGLITVPDPFGGKWVDEGRYDAVNHPELIPQDVYKRYVHEDGTPKFPEYRENYAAKTKALAAAEEQSRARILGRNTRMPATHVELEEDMPVSTPVCLRRPRAISEGGAKLRRRSRSRDRADWAPPPTIPDPEIPAYPQYTMPAQSTSLFPNPFERMGRKLSKLRR